MTHALFEPITLRGVEIPNRLWVPPMCQYSVDAQDGVATDWHLVHYGSLAAGGFGVVTVEATGILPEGRITPFCLGIWNDEQALALRRVADFIHSQGAKAAIQLIHAGRKASTGRGWPGWEQGSVAREDGGWQPVGPSAIAFPGLATPAELDREGIAEVVSAFAAAARRAVDAGFDIIEIHGAHGYLLHQFLSPLSNQRTDEYGGSLENRARLSLEVADAVRGEVGDQVPVVARLSATEWVDGGADLDQVAQASTWLGEHTVDFISVSSGGNITPAPIPAGPGYQVGLASRIGADSGLPVGAAGIITEPGQAEQIVALGQADVVYIGREALRTPHFPLLAAQAIRFKDANVPPQYARAYM